MKVFIAFLFYLFTLQINAQESIFKYKYSIESGKELIKVAKRIRQGEKMSNEDWSRFFQTDGYRRYLATKDSLQKKQWIKEAMFIAFDKNRKQEADSIAACGINLNSPNLMQTLIIQNFYLFSNKLNEASVFLDTINLPQILDTANQITKKYLPFRAYNDNPELNNTYILGREAEASVRGSSVFLDLNLAMSLTKEQLIELFAHEFHHNYRDMKIPGKLEDPLLNTINSFQAEGIADLINKKKFTTIDTYGPEMAKMYSFNFYNTPRILMEVDSITQAYLNKKIDYERYAKIENMIKFGGHTNGFYMALVIENNGGLRKLIDTYDNPVDFVKLYNKSAFRSKNEYVFSSEFISYLEKLWKKYVIRDIQ